MFEFLYSSSIVTTTRESQKEKKVRNAHSLEELKLQTKLILRSPEDNWYLLCVDLFVIRGTTRKDEIYWLVDIFHLERIFNVTVLIHIKKT